MRQAIRWRLLAEDPTNGAQLPRQRRCELRVLTAEQSRLFLEAAMQTVYGPVFAVALTTAARPSEYLALKWHDINWERGTVSIARTLEKGSGGWRFAETKRARSRRVIKLQGWVLELLTGLLTKTSSKPECGSWGGGAELIFNTPGRRPIDSDKLAKTCKSILQTAGLPMIRLYDFRHTGATLALAAGVPPKVVSEQLGHASAAFTLDIYSHVLPHMQEQAAMKVEELLLGHVLPKGSGRHGGTTRSRVYDAFGNLNSALMAAGNKCRPTESIANPFPQMTLLDVERHLLYLRGLGQRGNAEQLRRVDTEARR
jgi:integrase